MLKVYKNIRKASSTFVREYISTTKSARNDIEYQKTLLLLLFFYNNIYYQIFKTLSNETKQLSNKPRCNIWWFLCFKIVAKVL